MLKDGVLSSLSSILPSCLHLLLIGTQGIYLFGKVILPLDELLFLMLQVVNLLVVAVQLATELLYLLFDSSMNKINLQRNSKI